MFTTLSVVILSLTFIIIDLIPLYQNQEWVSFFLFLSLCAIALILAIAMDLSIEIPNLSDYIKKIVTFVYGLE